MATRTKHNFWGQVTVDGLRYAEDMRMYICGVYVHLWCIPFTYLYTLQATGVYMHT